MNVPQISLKQYESVISINRQTAKQSKYIVEFRLCAVPAKTRILLTSFFYTVVSSSNNRIAVKGSVFKDVVINTANEFFVDNSDSELIKAVVEYIIEQRIHEKAFMFQIYVITNAKIDEHSTGASIRSIAHHKLAEIINKQKEGKNDHVIR